MAGPPKEASESEVWGQLMLAAQNGDSAAYARLLRDLVPFIRAVARRHHAAGDRIDDVVQDVLLSIHRVRHTYDPARPFKHWIGAIAQRRSIDALRRRGRIDANEQVNAAGYETFPDPRTNTETEAVADTAVVRDAVAALPLAQRRAVELLRFRELSLAEAARASGQSEGALKVSLHRAIQSLRRILKEGRDGSR